MVIASLLAVGGPLVALGVATSLGRPLQVGLTALALVFLAIIIAMLIRPAGTHNEARRVSQEAAAQRALRCAREAWCLTLLRVGDDPLAHRRYLAVSAELDALTERLRAKEMEPDEVASAAAALGRMRVYVFPASHLKDLADGIVHDLTEWHVPGEALSGLREKAKRAAEPGPAAFSAVEDMLLDREYWDRETDTWDRMRWITSAVGGALVLLSLGLSFVAFSACHVVWGFVLAGIAGSGTSVLAKLPGPSVYGNQSAYWVRAAIRCITGLVAAVMGLGIIFSGIVTISFANAQTLLGVVSACVTACPLQNRAILFCIGAGLGFSERALVSVNDSILRRMGTP